MIRNAICAFLLASTAWGSPVAAREDAATTVLPTGPGGSATPVPVYDWSAGWKTKYPIHESCNSTLRVQLEDALDETVQLAQHARDHLLRFGHKSNFVQKYFGNGSTAIPIGWYDRVVAADKTGMTFRCDDPDRNCATQDRAFVHSPYPCGEELEITDKARMGWSLARREWHIGDGHLRSLLLDP